MLIVFAMPVIVAVAFVHRLMTAFAPSNVLIRNVRSARPRWGLATALVGLAVMLLLTVRFVADAVLAGAPGWLNMIVLVLAWDAVKVGWLAVGVILRGIGSVAGQAVSGSWRAR